MSKRSSSFMPWVDVGKDLGNVDGTHQNGSSPPSLPLTSDQNRLKKFVRKGHWPVDHSIRQELWHHICMLNVVTAGSVYKETARALFGDEPHSSSSDHNSNDSHQTFGNEDHLTTYKLDQSGRDELARLLSVLAHTRPEISYCPLLHPMASLLLHYMDAERAFDCLSALLGSHNYKYLDQSWVEFEAYRRSFTKLAKKFATQANSVIAKQSGEQDAVYQDWIWWILEDLPFTHLVRVIDCYLMEGLKIFYRVALAVLQLYKKRKGWVGSSGDFASSIREFTKAIPVTPEALLGICFQFRGLSRTVIDTYNTKFKLNIREEGSTAPIRKTNGIAAVLNEVNSSIITPKQLQSLWRWLPQRFSLMQPRLVFTTTEHGVSLNTFYNMCEFEEQTVLLIKTLDKEVFGAYLSSPWSTRNSRELKTSYFGNGESFLFTVTPTEQHFPWVGLSDREDKEPLDVASQLFMRGTRNLVSIGGGEGEGIHLENDISEGWSENCKTFNNPPLATNSRFQSEIIEVLAFQDVGHIAVETSETQSDPATDPVADPVIETETEPAIDTVGEPNGESSTVDSIELKEVVAEESPPVDQGP
ncbi:GTPase-activating protein skywalker-like [Asterias amurensis]|uniref:GTPase-activating protein skywalker-like n=1 Tax=Asterias amurensis TaxID=7602 RepID=UPI003AB69C68